MLPTSWASAVTSPARGLAAAEAAEPRVGRVFPSSVQSASKDRRFPKRCTSERSTGGAEMGGGCRRKAREGVGRGWVSGGGVGDRKSTRLNSSH